jgi:hypothetical protein
MIKFNKGRFINDLVHVVIGIAIGLGVAYACWCHEIGSGLAGFK